MASPKQRTFTDGRIYIVGRQARRKEQKRADYLLRYTRDFTLAVVEAKPESEIAGTGMQQAKEYGLGGPVPRLRLPCNGG